jgi:Tfp pilus assembly protein PilF
MSGHRWYSILLLSLFTSLTGCQADGSGKYAWNPFSKKSDASVLAKEDSSFSLPKFSSRKSPEPNGNDDANSPMAAEQLERLLEQGQLALQNNRLDDARKAYSEVLSSSPDNATAHHGMAMAADLSEKWGDAEYHYRQALRIRPRDANLLCDIGYSYLLQNRYSEASRYLNHAVEINPQHENAQMNLALLDLKQGNRAAAEARITQRFGSSVKSNQIIAQLESRAGTSSALPGPAPAIIPANATFEQVQAIMAQERLEAERRRATQGIPQDPQPWASASNGTAAAGNPQPGPATGIAAPENPNVAQSVAYATGMTGMSSSGALSQPAMSNSHLNTNTTASNSVNGGLPSNGGLQGSGMVPAIQSPGQNALASNQALASNSGSVAAPVAGNGTPTTAALPMSSPMMARDVAVPSAVGVAVPGATLGKVIPVHSSGVFQSAPTNGVSYGQPIGFGGPAGQISGQSVSMSDSMPMQSNGVLGTSTHSNFPVSNSAAPQPSSGQLSAQQIYLEGLNAGPGSLFPIGQASSAQAAAAGHLPDRSASSADNSSILRMGNVSSPGTNSMINGAMYGQPQSSLPAQEWMQQQQQQAQRQQSSLPQNSGMSRPEAVPAAWPSARPPESNPLDVYDRQLQQLDNTYNRTLQQMDRQNQQLPPRAQY